MASQSHSQSLSSSLCLILIISRPPLEMMVDAIVKCGVFSVTEGRLSELEVLYTIETQSYSVVVGRPSSQFSESSELTSCDVLADPFRKWPNKFSFHQIVRI